MWPTLWEGHRSRNIKDAMPISKILNPTDETDAEDGDEHAVDGEKILHKSI
jgi:hypothetical protein